MNQKSYSKHVKKRNFASNIFLTMNVILGTIPSLLVVYMVGHMADGSITKKIILWYSLVITGCLILKALFYGLSIWKAHEAAYGSLTEIRLDIIRHLRSMSLGFFQKRKTGDLANIINHDVEEVEVYLAHALPEIMASTLVPITVFVIISIIDWRMGIALVCTAPLMILFRKIMNRIWGKSLARYAESTKRMSEDLLEYIATIPVIKAFAKEEHKTRKVLNHMSEYITWVKRVMLSISVPMGLISMMLEGGLVVMVIVGSILLANGTVSTAGFVLALILGGVFLSAFAKLPTFQHYGIVYNQSIQNIYSIMGEKPLPKKNLYRDPEPGDIVFDNIDFSYSSDKKILAGINLCFREKSVNAIVGTSGSGKSTLASLIMGFWQPDSGSLSINGLELSDMSEEALSSLVSIVQQEVFLFNLSIEENIRIGKPDATKAEIIEAAKKAQIHDTIISLPDGYSHRPEKAAQSFPWGKTANIHCQNDFKECPHHNSG